MYLLQSCNGQTLDKARPLSNNGLEELLVISYEVSREVGADLRCG